MYTAKYILLLINFVFSLIVFILGLRVLLLLLSASPTAPFVSWIYEVSKTLLYPFQGIFPSPVLKGGFTLDMSSIVAILVYSFVAYIAEEFVNFISSNSERNPTKK